MGKLVRPAPSSHTEIWNSSKCLHLILLRWPLLGLWLPGSIPELPFSACDFRMQATCECARHKRKPPALCANAAATKEWVRNHSLPWLT